MPVPLPLPLPLPPLLLAGELDVIVCATVADHELCPHWDSNPDCDDFKSPASADWAMGALKTTVPSLSAVQNSSEAFASELF